MIDSKMLNKIVKNLNMRFPVAEISKDLDVSKSTVSEYLNGKKTPSRNFLELFENFYEINLKDYEDNVLDVFYEKEGVKSSMREIELVVSKKWKEFKKGELISIILKNELLANENKELKEYIARGGK